MPEQTLARSRLRFGPKNYVCLAAAMGFFWVAIGALLVALVVLRRRRDRARRATLDEGQLLDELDITP